MGDLLELPTNTAGWFIVGPFFDKGDGITPELSITVANSAITLAANANAESAPTLVLDAVAGNDGTNTLVHITNDDAGLYYLKLTASNNNRYGSGMLTIKDTDTYVTVFHPVSWVSAAYWNWKYGTTKPAVLLTSGTGTGELDFTSGVVKANLAQYLGTAFSGTAAQIVAAFVKFFDKASPTGTVNSLPDAVAGANNGLPTTNGTKINQTVDLQYLLGTAITEGAAGRLAAALTKLLDVATPALTAASVNQTGDTYAIANGDHGLVSIQDDIDSLVAAVITNAAGADVAADIIALKAVADLVEDILRNKLAIEDSTGKITLYADNNTDVLYEVATGIVDNLTTTIRKRLE